LDIFYFLFIFSEPAKSQRFNLAFYIILILLYNFHFSLV
jgi:hypothetical protein